MKLTFRKPTSFEIHDEGKYEILPVQVDDMEYFTEFIKEQKDLQKLAAKEAKKKKGMTKKELDMEATRRLAPFMQKLIDLCVLNVETGEPIPRSYRTPKKVRFFIEDIIEATSDHDTDMGDETPLDRKAENKS